MLEILTNLSNQEIDIETATSLIEKSIEEKFVPTNKLSDLENQFKQERSTLCQKHFLEKNGCKDSDFIMFKENKSLENINDLSKSSQEQLVTQLKQTHPAMFNTFKIDGIKPPDSSKSPSISKNDFKSMPYAKKMELFNTNKELYDTLI